MQEIAYRPKILQTPRCNVGKYLPVEKIVPEEADFVETLPKKMTLDIPIPTPLTPTVSHQFRVLDRYISVTEYFPKRRPFEVGAPELPEEESWFTRKGYQYVDKSSILTFDPMITYEAVGAQRCLLTEPDRFHYDSVEWFYFYNITHEAREWICGSVGYRFGSNYMDLFRSGKTVRFVITKVVREEDRDVFFATTPSEQDPICYRNPDQKPYTVIRPPLPDDILAKSLNVLPDKMVFLDLGKFVNDSVRGECTIGWIVTHGNRIVNHFFGYIMEGMGILMRAGYKVDLDKVYTEYQILDKLQALVKEGYVLYAKGMSLELTFLAQYSGPHAPYNRGKVKRVEVPTGKFKFVICDLQCSRYDEISDYYKTALPALIEQSHSTDGQLRYVESLVAQDYKQHHPTVESAIFFIHWSHTVNYLLDLDSDYQYRAIYEGVASEDRLLARRDHLSHVDYPIREMFLSSEDDMFYMVHYPPLVHEGMMRLLEQRQALLLEMKERDLWDEKQSWLSKYNFPVHRGPLFAVLQKMKLKPDESRQSVAKRVSKTGYYNRVVLNRPMVPTLPDHWGVPDLHRRFVQENFLDGLSIQGMRTGDPLNELYFRACCKAHGEQQSYLSRRAWWNMLVASYNEKKNLFAVLDQCPFFGLPPGMCQKAKILQVVDGQLKIT